VVPDARGLHLSRGERDSLTHTGTASKGHVTTAWLDHGNAPAGAGYEYVILPGTKLPEIARRALSPDYTVVRKDRAAHVVACASEAALGYVIFDADIQLSAGALMKVSAPVIIYEKTLSQGHLHLSLADPDLRMGRTPTYASRAITPAEIVLSKAMPVRVTLKGTWTLTGDLQPGVRLLPRTEASTVTVIEFAAIDGKTFELSLNGS
jgi:hypothetical protein